jgi:alkylation response protein AidB-like acyl-CoA dehydrogenase
MNFEFSEEQQMLREQARGFLSEHCTTAVVRAVLDDDAGWDHSLWQKVAEMGWTATTIPEAYGGLGLSYYELAIIAEELGRAVAPLPFSSSIYLACEAINRFGTEGQKSAWLPKLASGECVAAFAMTERPGRLVLEQLETQRTGERITGGKTTVPDAAVADVAVVLARAGSALELCLVPLKQEGVTAQPVLTLDASRSHSNLLFEQAEAQRLGDRTLEPQEWDRLLDGAAVMFSWEQLGVAESALIQARDYALQRYAFGRAIGSYQAIKHKLAGMYVKNTLARSNAYYGIWALAEGSDELPLAAATARVAAIQASTFAAEENIQTHGGMGFTWEFDCHFYYRRAKLLSLVIGSESVWQDRLVDALNRRSVVAA